MALPAPTIHPHPKSTAHAARDITRERRRRTRRPVPPMYSEVTVRVLSEKAGPLEGHAVNISEGGLAVELDALIPAGAPVALEFRIAGLGRMRMAEWPLLAATAEVVRHDHLDDFPRGPYRTALRFVKIPTMAQAQIARYIAARGT